MSRCMNLCQACPLLERQPLFCVCVCARLMGWCTRVRMKHSDQFCLISGPKYFEACPHFCLPKLITQQRLFLTSRRNITKPKGGGEEKDKMPGLIFGAWR